MTEVSDILITKLRYRGSSCMEKDIHTEP